MLDCSPTDRRPRRRTYANQPSWLLTLLVASVLWPSWGTAAEPVPGTTSTTTVPHATDSMRQMQQREQAADTQPPKTPGAAPDHRTTPPQAVPNVKKKAGHLPAIPSAPPQSAADAALSAERTAAPPPARSFQGLLDTGWIPPDTQGAVGPNHLLEMLNNGVGVFDKATGEKLTQVTLQTFWSSLGTRSGEPAADVFDPKVLYDQYAQRFVVISIGGRAAPNSWLLLGVSAGPDPTGDWLLYAIDADRTNGVAFNEWADFPGLGLDSRFYYVTAKMMGPFQGKLWVFPKTSLFQHSATIEFSEFRSTTLAQATQPAHSFGDADSEYLVSANWTIDQGASPNALRIGRVQALPTPHYEDLGFVAVQPYRAPFQAPQPNGARPLEVHGQGVLNAVFRDGRLWTAQHIRTDDGQRSQIGWYELDPAEASLTEAGAPIQEGRVSDPSLSFYYPSLMVNRDGHVMIGFSGSSPNTFVGGYYTVRERGSASGSTQSVTRFKDGLGLYVKTYNTGRNRWGDYSATVVDPDDDRTFWTIQAYADTPVGNGSTDGQGRWGTWWATTKFGTYTVSISRIGTGQGTVRSARREIDCGSICRTELGNGQSLTVTAEAAPGSTFAGWSGAGCSGTGSCAISADAAVTATFDADMPPPPPAAAAGPEGSGGGCVLRPGTPFDPLLPLAFVTGVAYLMWRRRPPGAPS